MEWLIVESEAVCQRDIIWRHQAYFQSAYSVPLNAHPHALIIEIGNMKRKQRNAMGYR